MSDDWAQCPICGSDVGAGAVADYDRAAYETGVQDTTLRATQYERILLDLIAEINDKNHGCCGCGWADEAADRAEARLREGQHPLHDTHPPAA